MWRIKIVRGIKREGARKTKDIRSGISLERYDGGQDRTRTHIPGKRKKSLCVLKNENAKFPFPYFLEVF